MNSACPTVFDKRKLVSNTMKKEIRNNNIHLTYIQVNTEGEAKQPVNIHINYHPEKKNGGFHQAIVTGVQVLVDIVLRFLGR
jgi:hypothetical protein